jgi:hypothetical protein
MNTLYPVPYHLIRLKRLAGVILFAAMSHPAMSATINAYAKVTSISGNLLTLSNINQTYHTFAVGEQVILIQMQDNVIGSNTGNNSSFGSITSIGSAGQYASYTIESLAGATMRLTVAPGAGFNTAASLQVVSFNNLGTSFSTTGSITALPWDGNVGGVVALQVSGTLTVNDNITADGAGFRGGTVSGNYSGSCNPNLYLSMSGNYGMKAEGIQYSNYSGFSARGPLANGAGGAADNNAGGGGGGNYTAGGLGGPGSGCTVTTASGGLGGLSLGTYITGTRFFMGGGGGGGQQNNTSGGNGGRGGGIVIIRANKIATGCFLNAVTISAEGTAGGNSQTDGAGGAGAGGTVVLAVSSYAPGFLCPLVVQADGGNGGGVQNFSSYGGGGGGGQGALVFTAALPTNIITSTDNGNGGDNSYFGTNAGDGTGTGNAGILAGYPIALPVEMLSFDATEEGDVDQLNWVTPSGPQPVAFTVERSADGTDFGDIGMVPGGSDDGADGQYQFTDASPLPGRNFYRVRASDLAGNSKYTAVVLVRRSEAAGAFQVFPNPAHGSFTLQLASPENGTTDISIENLSGATVYRGELQANEGRIMVHNIGLLTPGTYLVRVHIKSVTQSGKLLVH